MKLNCGKLVSRSLLSNRGNGMNLDIHSKVKFRLAIEKLFINKMIKFNLLKGNMVPLFWNTGIIKRKVNFYYSMGVLVNE